MSIVIRSPPSGLTRRTRSVTFCPSPSVVWMSAPAYRFVIAVSSSLVKLRRRDKDEALPWIQGLRHVHQPAAVREQVARDRKARAGFEPEPVVTFERDVPE